MYRAPSGTWYFKATLGRDPLTSKRIQLTKRGFTTATDASRARREALEAASDGTVQSISGGLSVDDLLDLYLDGIDADGRLSAKTRFDYRRNADGYVRPWLGRRRVRELTPEVILAWQRELRERGGTKGRQAAVGGLGAPGAGIARRSREAGRRARSAAGEPTGVGAAAAGEAVGPEALDARRGALVPAEPGERTAVPAVGVPDRLGRADRRAGLAAVVERRPGHRTRSNHRVRHDAGLGSRPIERQERDGRAHHRPRRRPGRRPSPPAGGTALRSPIAGPRAERVRVHETPRWDLPPAAGVKGACRPRRQRRAAAADCARTAPHPPR